MFEKLLAVLPYNPGLSHQVAFYSRRMREESSIRRIGMIFIVLAFMIQFFAVLAPPKSTSADTTNDLIAGGISGAADAANHCNNNVRNYKDILANYGISCEEVGQGTHVTVNACGQDYYSFGHNPYGFSSEQPVNIPNGGTIFVRKLSAWGCTSYDAVKVVASTGKNFFILYPCGNLTSIGIPQPVAPAPQPCQYDASIAASSPQCFNKCQYNAAIPASSPQCYNKCQYNPAIPASSPQCFNECQWNKSIAASDAQCFDHCPIAGKTSLHKSDAQCVGTCPYKASLAANSPQCFPPCQYNAGISANSPACTTTTPTPTPTPAPLCQYNSSLAANSPDCKACDKSVSSSDTTACIVVHKTASNITTGTADANNTTAHGGDVISYTLYAQNTGKDTVKDFVFQENLSDVMDYADPTDLHGGTIDNNGAVTWPKQDIAAGATATVQVTVTVKNPVPQTPVSPSDPNHFDLVMTNVYGNTININLPGSPPKTIETTAASLPNTGPGTSLFIASAIVIIGGYFYGRARLLAKESNLALQESTGA